MGRVLGPAVGPKVGAEVGAEVGTVMGPTAGTTALLTDRYELTMLEAALRSGHAESLAVFEVFSRRIPEGRPWAVFAGLGRLVDAIGRFQFGPAELSWLDDNNIVGKGTLEWLSGYRFTGSIDSYREGELYTAGSPVLTLKGTFAETVLLETLVLSTLNFDSAVASAASLVTLAAAGRPVIEMGGRSVHPVAAVAAARAAYLAGFASTSNLEAGRRYGIPTAGTASHAFVMSFGAHGEDHGGADGVHPGEEIGEEIGEREAFAAQVDAFGPGTTLLVDTYDTGRAVRAAVEVAGPRLGGVRVDSGDLAEEAVKARALLDGLGAGSAKVVVTGDLDARAVAALAAAPVDVYGAGVNVVTGMGAPTAGLVYKLVAIGEPGTPAAAPLRPVAKRSAGKESFGGRKWAWRARLAPPQVKALTWADIVTTSPGAPGPGARALQVPVIEDGSPTAQPSLEQVREFHARVRDEVGLAPLVLERR